MGQLEVLLLGGTRFLGYALARRLVDAGHAVTVFTRGRSPRFPEGALALHGDRADRDGFRRLFRGRSYDAVIDLIAFDAPDAEAAVGAFAGAVGHFIHISSGAVYTVLERVPCPLREEHFEGQVREPGRPSAGHAYGVGKRRCEEALWRAHRELGFPVTALRLPIILGELDPTRRAASYCRRLLDGGPLILPDAGRNVMTFVYRDDAAAFIAANLKNPAVVGEAINLAQDEAPAVREVVEEAARILGATPDLVDIPLGLLREIGFDFAASPYSSPHPLLLANGKAKVLGGFAPTPMAHWLPEVVRDAVAGEPPADLVQRPREREIARAYREAAAGLAARCGAGKGVRGDEVGSGGGI